MIRVFIYGSLMKNRYNHDHYLKGQKYLGEAILTGYSLYDLGSFPGIIPEAGERVMGEVYEIDKQTLYRLDVLEDNGHLYTRKLVDVSLKGETIQAEVYVWNGRVSKNNKIDFEAQPWAYKPKNKKGL